MSRNSREQHDSKNLEATSQLSNKQLGKKSTEVLAKAQVTQRTSCKLLMTEKSTARKNTEHAFRASGERRKPISGKATQALRKNKRKKRRRA